MKVAASFFLVSLTIVAFAGSAVAATPKSKTHSPQAVATPAPAVGTAFRGTGKVSLFRGAPCTSQIMFELRMARVREPVFLAAHLKESSVLTEASRKRRSVQVLGTWERGRQKTCRYVTVTQAAVLKGFFSW